MVTFSALALGGCEDTVTDLEPEDVPLVPLVLTLEGHDFRPSIEVTAAPGSAEEATHHLHPVGSVRDRSIYAVVLPGEDVEVHLQALNSSGVMVYEGTATLDPREALNEPVVLSLDYEFRDDPEAPPLQVEVFRAALHWTEPVDRVAVGTTDELGLSLVEATPTGEVVASEEQIDWESADASVVSVDESGRVTGVSEGSTMVTASIPGLAIETSVEAVGAAEVADDWARGAFRTWYDGAYSHHNTFWLSNASFQSASVAAHGGNIDFAGIPRAAIENDPEYVDYAHVLERVWSRSTAALDSARLALEANAAAAEAGDERVEVMARVTQGLAHATLALWYDQGWVVDVGTGTPSAADMLPYTELAGVAYQYFDQALALTEGADWELPGDWVGHAGGTVSPTLLSELIHSWRALFRASMARTPDEAVDWTAVLADLDQGLAATYEMDFYNGAYDMIGGPSGWGAETYYITGMADQEGAYQRWLDVPAEDRLPWFGADMDDDPFLIQTPDTRFPQGATLEEQIAAPGDRYVIPTPSEWGYSYTEHFSLPARGTWRWGYYYSHTSYPEYWVGPFGDWTAPHIKLRELELLRAEALLETGNPGGAATIVNQTRTAHGLDGTDAGGTNLDCVPRLPDESCGGLMEMLKWEKRLETRGYGALMVLSWFWDARRWGDHYRGTALHLPVPAHVLTAHGMPVYTFGGPDGSPSGTAGVSTYGWPGETD